MAHVLSNGHVTDDVTVRSAVRSAILATDWLLVLNWTNPVALEATS